MPIDIETLSEAELIDLNHRIVARLRLLRQLEAHASMLEFRIGERVSFHLEGRSPVTGVITRYNKKTVSLVTDSGQLWNVAPQLLERTRPEDRAAPSAGGGTVIPLPRPGRKTLNNKRAASIIDVSEPRSRSTWMFADRTGIERSRIVWTNQKTSPLCGVSAAASNAPGINEQRAAGEEDEPQPQKAFQWQEPKPCSASVLPS